LPWKQVLPSTKPERVERRVIPKHTKGFGGRWGRGKERVDSHQREALLSKVLRCLHIQHTHPRWVDSRTPSSTSIPAPGCASLWPCGQPLWAAEWGYVHGCIYRDLF
jgi:hypothetical protein